MKKILVTGAAGFIGHALIKNLLQAGNSVVGVDSINDYYDVRLKRSRLNDIGIDINDNSITTESTKYKNFKFLKGNIENKNLYTEISKFGSYEIVVNLAAQAGVRYSIENPHAYIQSNVVGFHEILNYSMQNEVDHFIYASSSSVYGMNEKMPYSPIDKVDTPVSLYAATKKSNELIAHSYSFVYGIPTTGLRFFTVYGPWGRPDMAPYIFTDAIIHDRPIKVFNNGNMRRDFTFIDDIVAGICKVVQSSKKDVYSVHNIGNGTPINLLEFIKTLEKHLGKKADMKMLPLQKGDVVSTWADIGSMQKEYNYRAEIDIDLGTKRFIDWYKKYHSIV